MKLLIRATGPDGAPLPKDGEILDASDALGVVEAMRAQTPFTARLGPRTYMAEVLAGVEPDPAPLPEDPAQAASDFLMRLAKRGLIAFLPEGKAVELDPGEDLPCADK
jgi:hypothetical protein